MKKTVEVVSRMAPGNRELIFECDKKFKLEVSNAKIKLESMGESLYTITGIENHRDYTIKVKTNDGLSCERQFCCGEFPGKIINYIHPEDKIFYPSGMCPATPSIIKLESGRLLVSHDIFYRDMAQNLTLVFYSDDMGDSWHYLSLIEGCLWGKLFAYSGSLYMLGNLHEYGDLVLYKASKDVRNWEKSCTIIDGGNKFTGGPHKSAMPVVECDGRIWTSVEYGSWSLGGHACGYVTASGDINEKDNWIVSDFLEYSSEWTGTAAGNSSGCIEGNILMKPDGTLIDFLRYGIETCEPNYGKALYLNIDRESPGKKPEFGEVVDFEGNHSKFTIKYDNKTGRYWTIVNRADRAKPKRRNEVVLMSSLDIDNWNVEKVLLDYEHNGWHEDDNLVGFQYVDFIFQDNEIFYVSRTALNGALNYHDSNCITFHKVRYC